MHPDDIPATSPTPHEPTTSATPAQNKTPGNHADTKPRNTASTDAVGRVYLPGGSGTPVGRYDFIVDQGTGRGIEVGVPVTAATSEGDIIGAVVDMRTVGTDHDPVAVELASAPGIQPVGTVPEVVVAQVQVFHSDTLRPVRSGTVRPASVAEIARATGYDRIDWPIAAGVVPTAEGTFAPVYFDGHALLGPESQGLCVGGLSGQAAKSSYIGVVMAGAISAGSEHKDRTASLVFNVKGTDYCYLDQPPAAGYELSDDDREMYRVLGIDPSPFKNVTVYAPALPAGAKGTRSDRDDAARLAWDLTMVWPYLRFFLGNVVYEDEKVLSFLAEFRQHCLEHPNPAARVDTFGKLEAWFEDRLAEAEANETPYAWRSHHKATMWRMRRMLSGLVARGGGLVSIGRSEAADDVPVSGWQHGEVVVVDIAGLTADVQGVVIARTVERLLRSAENGELGVDHLMLVMDELNTFAPASGAEMAPVRKVLQKVATQGRYAGISLISAGQALSRVDELVLGNAASRALGRTGDAELATGAYGRMPGGLAERVATLPKGWMALSHYAFRSVLLVRFPRPAWQTGRSQTTGGKRPKSTGVLNLSQRSLNRLKEGMSDDMVETVIAGSPDAESARARLEAARIPDMRKTVVTEQSTFDPENPFSLD